MNALYGLSAEVSERDEPAEKMAAEEPQPEAAEPDEEETEPPATVTEASPPAGPAEPEKHDRTLHLYLQRRRLQS
jgi:hypothetical protein